MDDSFYNAFLPARVRICGRKLDGLTLWQAFLLAASGSPFAGFSDRIRPQDLVAAAKICTARHGQPFRYRQSLRDAWWVGRLKRRPDLFRRECRRFSQFIADHNKGPVLWHRSDGGGISLKAAPTMLRLACSLMAMAGLDESAAWNCTMGKALWMDGALGQINGQSISFLCEDDLDDSEIDLSGLTDEEALAKFRRDLPPDLVDASFEHWRINTKRHHA